MTARAPRARRRKRGPNELDGRPPDARPQAAGQLAVGGEGGRLRADLHRDPGGRVLPLLAGTDRADREGPPGRGEAEGSLPREEEARREPRSLQAAARGDRAVLRRAPEAAAEQERD